MNDDQLHMRLRAACERAAHKMGLLIEGERLDLLQNYAEELRLWNKAYNLVGRKIGTEGLIDLFVDALTPLCVKGLLDGRKEVLDIGSGAGLPGVPLYIVAGPFPLTMVESQRKKITFLRHTARKLGLEDAKAYAGRMEDMSRQEDYLNAYEVGLARAVMDPLRLIRLARPFICEGGRLVVFVGKADGDRIRRASPDLRLKGAELEALRSTRRITGKDNFLAVIRKTEAMAG